MVWIHTNHFLKPRWDGSLDVFDGKLHKRPRRMKTLRPDRLLLRRKPAGGYRHLLHIMLQLQRRVCWTCMLPTPLCGLYLLIHFFPEAQRPHVRPDFLDVGQALRLRAAFASIPPTQRILPVRRPDRVLLFMIHNDLINRIIFSLFHTVSPFVLRCLFSTSWRSSLRK